MSIQKGIAELDPVARESALDSGVVPKRQVQIVRGEASTVWDADGNAYLDAGATFGTNHVGHRHPRVVQAVKDQLDRLMHVTLTWPNDTRLGLLERLVAAAPDGLERAFLCATGTEANECALKFARQATGRKEVLYLSRSFHGRTMGALSATAKRAYQEPFEPLVPGFRMVRANDPEALKEALSAETAALILEPVQGEGGVLPLDREYLKTARDLTADAGALLIADEVQTGMGRTGRFFAFDDAGILPDLVSVGKGLGGGLPVAATLMTQDVAAKQATLSHGSTFSGNPVQAAAAAAVLDVLKDERLVERSATLGERMLDDLRVLEEVPGVRGVRGRGLMIGVELKAKPQPVLESLRLRGILALSAGATVVRLLPPFVLSDAEADHIVGETKAAVLEQTTGADAA
ncbi:MAG: aspartate aminotransferase family protein [Euryarchaeota archaeon]|nr:aspartate aminotransferase family protein [Euryarchaeota archaeon]